MSDNLLEKLESKISNAVDVIELLRVQLEELETKNKELSHQQEEWQSSILQLLEKFDNVELSSVGLSEDDLQKIEEIAVA